jgi:hypothetical protein
MPYQASDLMDNLSNLVLEYTKETKTIAQIAAHLGYIVSDINTCTKHRMYVKLQLMRVYLNDYTVENKDEIKQHFPKIALHIKSGAYESEWFMEDEDPDTNNLIIAIEKEFDLCNEDLQIPFVDII